MQDETGEEGVIVVADNGSKKVKMGARLSSSKVRQSEHESSAQAAQVHDRNSQQIALATTDKARPAGPRFPCPLFCAMLGISLEHISG